MYNLKNFMDEIDIYEKKNWIFNLQELRKVRLTVNCPEITESIFIKSY